MSTESTGGSGDIDQSPSGGASSGVSGSGSGGSGGGQGPPEHDVDPEIPRDSTGVRVRREREIDLFSERSSFNLLPGNIRRLYRPCVERPHLFGNAGHRCSLKAGRWCGCEDVNESRGVMVDISEDDLVPRELNVYQSMWPCVYTLDTTNLECKPCPRFHLIVSIKDYNHRREGGVATTMMEELLKKLR
jgi:hypothetical protein